MTARTRRTAVNFMAAVPVADGRLKNRTKVNNKSRKTSRFLLSIYSIKGLYLLVLEHFLRYNKSTRKHRGRYFGYGYKRCLYQAD